MIRPLQWLLPGIVALSASCVVFPTSRTYFEPDPAFGEPISSASCGYNRTANDGLQRVVEGVTVQVFPIYLGQRPLLIRIAVPRTSRRVEFFPEMTVLKVESTQDGFHPASIKSDSTPGPYFDAIIDITFPIAADDAAAIEILLPLGFIVLDGSPLDIAPFRFVKVRKSDVYYGSINC